MERKTKNLIFGTATVLILLTGFYFLEMWRIKKYIEKLLEPPVFTEEECKMLLAKRDSSILEMEFEEQQLNYHIDFSNSDQPITWKINSSEPITQGVPPQKLIFFVSSEDIFEGCGIRFSYIGIGAEINSGYEHFKCKGDRNIWVNVHKNPKFVFLHSLLKSPQGEGEVIYYYSNINSFGEDIVNDSYETVKNECEKL